jgi:hypothetical protein
MVVIYNYMAGMKKDDSVEIIIFILGGVTLTFWLAAIVSMLLGFW